MSDDLGLTIDFVERVRRRGEAVLDQNSRWTVARITDNPNASNGDGWRLSFHMTPNNLNRLRLSSTELARGHKCERTEKQDDDGNVAADQERETHVRDCVISGKGAYVRNAPG